MNQNNEINRNHLDNLKGSYVIEFGATWCGYCQASQSILAEALALYPLVTLIKIEDGKGMQLGRTYKIKLWPTLVFLKDGLEVIRLVRPTDKQSITNALIKLE
jgi:thioredoxin 1